MEKTLVSQDKCTNMKVTRESLVVKYGDPAELNCSVTNKPVGRYILGWESVESQPQTSTEMSVMWKVNSLTNWEEQDIIKCYLSSDTACYININLIMYKDPDRITLRAESEVWKEGEPMELKCEIENVGRGHDLSVEWSRTDQTNTTTFTLFNETSFPDLGSERNSVSKTATVTVTPRREDDGTQYQCTAVLNHKQGTTSGTRISSSSSLPLNITVHYKPNITKPFHHLELATGESLTINCSAQGNPTPRYNWFLLNDINNSSPRHLNTTTSSYFISRVCKEHEGQYICTADNKLGKDTWAVSVTVQSTDWKPIVAVVTVAVLMAVVVVIGVICSYYRRTHMGQYILRQLRAHRQNIHMDLNAED